MKDMTVKIAAELIDKIRADLCEYYDSNPVCERCAAVCPYDQVLDRLRGIIKEVENVESSLPFRLP